MNPWVVLLMTNRYQNKNDGIWVAIWNKNNTKKFPLVWSFVSLLCQVNHGEILAGWPVQGFRADLVCRLPTQLLIIEVNSQQRCWIARDGKWRDSWDDSFPFPTKNSHKLAWVQNKKRAHFCLVSNFFKKTILAPVSCGDRENQTELSQLQEKNIKSSISFVKKNARKNSQICWGFYLGTRRELLASCRLRRAALESGGKVCQAWQTPLIFFIVLKMIVFLLLGIMIRNSATLRF